MTKANVDEKEWVIQISQILNNERENDIKNPVCIFQVPKAIRDTKPEAYIPQVVALGGYHHFRPETYYMQKYKISTALHVHEQLNLQEFKLMATEIKKNLPEVRASYYDNLGVENETLAWMMLIDSLFLLSLIYNPGNNHIRKEETNQLEDSSGRLQSSDQSTRNELEVPLISTNDRLKENNCREEKTGQFKDTRGKKHSLDMVLKDVVLLENQVPIIVLEALLIMETEADWLPRSKDLWYNNKVIDFCTDLSPLNLLGNDIHKDTVKPHHVLDYVHQLVWLGKSITPDRSNDIDVAVGCALEYAEIWNQLYDLCSLLNCGFLSMILAVVDLILKVLKVLGISIARDVFSEKEVLIPNASKLSDVGVKFRYTECSGYNAEVLITLQFGGGGGIKKIAFKKRPWIVTLSLPVLKNNFNSYQSEVLMRNLLAYEAKVMPESPKFSRYVELMSGLMQTTADVELLKKADPNIPLVPHNADNAEVVKFFGSLKEAIGSKGTSELDDTIKEVNEYYNNCSKVKNRRLAKKCLFISWKVLTGVALMVVLMLLLLRLLCSVHSCPDIFKS